jgi:tetratricopeptide (TPR) repeat protein
MAEAHNYVNRTLQAVSETLTAFRSLVGRLEAIAPLPHPDETFSTILALERVRQANGLIQKGQPMEALPFATAAVGLAPQLASTWWCRGTVQFLLRNQAAAIADLSQTAALGKQDADTFLIRGFAYHDAGNFAAAIQDYQIAQQLTYGDTTVIGLNIKFAQAGQPRRT